MSSFMPLSGSLSYRWHINSIIPKSRCVVEEQNLNTNITSSRNQAIDAEVRFLEMYSSKRIRVALISPRETESRKSISERFDSIDYLWRIKSELRREEIREDKGKKKEWRPSLYWIINSKQYQMVECWSKWLKDTYQWNNMSKVSQCKQKT